MKRRLLSAFAFALAAVGCGHADIHEVVLRAAPPTGRPVDVYLEGQAIEAPVDDVALLQVMAYGNVAGTEAVVELLRRRALALGCDALVRVRIANGVTGTHGFGVCVKLQQR